MNNKDICMDKLKSIIGCLGVMLFNATFNNI